MSEPTALPRAWPGVIEQFRDRLELPPGTPTVSLGEGGTPLVPAPALSQRVGAQVWVKIEGCNPTGSFKDRGMTTAISVAKGQGAQAVICASTGNTSASAAAYAVRAGMTCAVLVPQGRIAVGKLAQAIAFGATVVQVNGNFDDCLNVARGLAQRYPVALMNSVNPMRLQGQKTAAFEVVDVLGQAPTIHVVPVGNAANIAAYWMGYQQEHREGRTTELPHMWGVQAAGAAPIVLGHPVQQPDTIATAIRIGNPASWRLAEQARDDSGGRIVAVSDEQILAAHRLLSREDGLFVEPASAAPAAGLITAAQAGQLPAGQRVVLTATGNGLKDPQWAVSEGVQPVCIEPDPDQAAQALQLQRA